MRIISGKYKNRELTSPKSSSTHPMGSRERLAIFNMLASAFGTPDLSGKTVLDVFAGTGAEGVFTAIRDGLGGFIDTAFAGGFLGWAFLLTSGVLMLGEWLSARAMKRHKSVRGLDAVVMGLMQAVAVLPGVSRSGSTIAGGRAMGLNGKKTADFAFLMSIPAILGAVVMDGKDILTGEIAEALPVVPMIVGVLVSMVFGFIAIRFMIAAVKKSGMKWFAVYTFVLGVLVLVDQYILHIFF